MTTDIIKDKFLVPVLVTLFLGIYGLINTDYSFLIMVIILIILTILCLAMYLRRDLYIHSISGDSKSINIEYQKNFSEKQIENTSFNLNTIKSVDFRSKSFLDPFYKISIQYSDENGIFDKTTFKTNDNKTYMELINKLNNENNEAQTRE